MKYYGVLIEKFDHKKNSARFTIFICLLSYLRQLVIALAITMLSTHLCLALALLNFIIFSYFMFTIENSALKDKYERIKQIINEFLLLFLNYHMFLMTDFVDPSHITNVGNSVISTIILNVVLNLFITACDLMPQIIKSLKRYH
jgi:hypothetical protein